MCAEEKKPENPQEGCFVCSCPAKTKGEAFSMAYVLSLVLSLECSSPEEMIEQLKRRLKTLCPDHKLDFDASIYAIGTGPNTGERFKTLWRIECPACKGETVQFFREGTEPPFEVCPLVQFPGHLTAVEVQAKIAERLAAPADGRTS